MKITGDKSIIFKKHVPPIKKKNMINNKMRWQKPIFNGKHLMSLAKCMALSMRQHPFQF